jgi:arylsulfatase A-like enzyme
MGNVLNSACPLLVASLLVGCNNPGSEGKMPGRPNIIWIVAEDMSDHWSCYGEKTIVTPHIDKLAQEGVLFEHAFVTAPVCSPCRSALITGMYQTLHRCT